MIRAVDLELGGRAALVTGAAGGIGRAVARRLTEEGARVALLDRAGSTVAAAAEQLHRAGADVRAAPADVTDAAAVRAAVSEAAAAFGGLDMIVGCAGVSGPVGTPLADTAPADWRRVLEVNATGTFLVLQAAIPLLRASDAASVAVVASDSAFVASGGMAPYGASKAAVLQLARAAAVELAGDRIRVNAVCPSIVDTTMSRSDLGLAAGFGDVGYPVQTADDVAAQLVWLVSPISHTVNATSVVMDFGYSARSNFPA